MFKIALVKGDYCVFDKGYLTLVRDNGATCIGGKVLSIGTVSFDREVPEGYTEFLNCVINKCNVQVARAFYLHNIFKIKALKTILSKEKNIRIKYYNQCSKCPICGRVEMENANFFGNVSEMKEKQWNGRIIEISKGDELTIIHVAGEVTDKECKMCIHEEGTASYVEEGPFGGAFRDEEDYYRWKNGSLTL